MIDTQKKIAIIPARGGSKRFVQKNIQILHGKPLITWTIEAAINAKCFDAIVVTSDDEQILDVARDYQADGVLAYKRPDYLAGDNVTTAKVITDVILAQESNGSQYDIVCELLPTCPLRNGQDIQDALELLTDKIDAVVSMKVSSIIPDFLFANEAENQAKPYFKDSKIFTGVTRSQDYPTLYYPNGAIYLGWVSSYKAHESFYTENFAIFPMPESRSVDIDTKEDFLLAGALLSLT